jgi:hypothetical protein
MMKKTLILVSSILVCSCKSEQTVDISKTTYEVLAAKEYATGNELIEVRLLSFPDLKKPIKSIELSSFLYVLDLAQGIHIYSVNGNSTQKFAFLKMPACTDFEIQNNVMVVSSARKLIFINLSNIVNKTFGLIGVKNDLMAYPNYPFAKNIAFECPDSTKYATDWEVKTIEKIECFR